MEARFDPSADLGVVSPSWVNLSGLPLEFWDHNVFRDIADSFGSLFQAVEKLTMQRSRLIFARICVNVEVNQVLPISITLRSKFGRWNQIIEYMKMLPCFTRTTIILVT